MTDWQTVLAGTLIIATVIGNPGVRLVVVMWANLALTMALADNLQAVAVADVVCAAVLLTGPRREKVVALLFAAMVPVYGIGHLIGAADASTYAVIDVIAFAQLAIVGGVDRGIRNLGAAFDRRRLVGRRGHIGRRGPSAIARTVEKESRG